MKSLVCNVFGMAVGVACLALILNRPTVADDEQAAQEQKQVIVVQSDDGKTVQAQEQVIVVKADDTEADAGDAVKKALHGKLEGLPAEIQKKIQQKLKAVKAAHGAKQDVQVKVIAVGSDEEAAAAEQSASQEQHTATVVAKAFPGGEEKHMVVAVAVDGKEVTGDDQEKTITVTVKDGKVIVNGKPVKVPELKGVKEGEIKVEVKADDETGAVTAEVKEEGKPGRKATFRKMLIMGTDGQAKSVEMDADSAVGGIAFGEGHIVVAGDDGAKADAAKQTYTLTIVGDEDAKSDGGPRTIHLRALPGKPGSGELKVDCLTTVPGVPLPHAFHFQPWQAGKADADLAKRLKGIESELKQIRKLLEKMQQEDADD